MNDVVLVSGARTPIGAFGGGLKDVPDHELAAVALRAALERGGVRPDQVSELILGNVIVAGSSAYNPRRVSSAVGMAEESPSFGVNKLCGSGLKAVHLAWQSVREDERSVVAAGGTENMSQAPYLLPDARHGRKLGHLDATDSLMGALTCGVSGLAMGLTAENIASRYGISRQEQDEYAALSHERAVRARDGGRLDLETVPVTVARGVVSRDERPAPTTADGIAGLRPTFSKDGTVTAANASGINDGAAMLLVASGERARAEGWPVLARLRGFASSGVDPAVMGLGPSRAIPRLLERAGVALSDVGLIEVNEAFAAQMLGVQRDLGLDLERTNVNGGAVALGHPLGMSGARVLLTLAIEMSRRDVELGVASLCVGGGQGIACLVERA